MALARTILETHHLLGPLLVLNVGLPIHSNESTFTSIFLLDIYVNVIF
jgi:hypothetical protein